MFTSNCGFFHCGQASRQAYSTGPQKTQSAALLSKKKAKIMEKPQFSHSEIGHVNKLSLTEKPQTTMEVTNFLLS